MKVNVKVLFVAAGALLLLVLAIGLLANLRQEVPATTTPTGNETSLDVFPEARNTFDPLAPPPRPPADYSGPPTSLGFSTASHDFGIVPQNSVNTYAFEFINTGQAPLVITNALGSCGCTVPEYPKHPIAPGQKGEIKVVYKSGMQEGRQMKTVTVSANTAPGKTVLRITADVQKAH
jgi:hypothetical protein